MSPQFQAPTGTHDVLAPESARWEVLVAAFSRHAGAAGYGLVVGPSFEELAVYERVGDSTDIVRKEMYDFEDKGGRRLALRPDSTPSVVRAFVQHRPPLPWKAWYVAPHFRYDRPQAGRYRQHHQVGAEVLGTDDPAVDVEVIALAWDFIGGLGVRGIELMVNSIGDPVCRPGYREALLAHLEARTLCNEHAGRYADNPLRVLDCKRDACIAATAEAPRLVAHLCEPCAAHFGAVTAGLEALGIPFRLEGRLVRGQDYYTRTTFEFASNALEGAQNGVGGGGRYDGFVEAMGGPATPGIGFGLGIERLLLAADAEGVFGVPDAPLDAFVVDTAGGSHALLLTRELRQAGMAADRAYDNRSMKAQVKAADKSGARFALIIGEDEAAAGTVVVRDLRQGTAQESVARDDVIDTLRKRLP
ncbi:MAG TPA: histidine--tRNA ligase [Acidimicrobiales bacterium]|nr:histidine--tRNA ligase [Acidimicrobiales bacterium]